MAIRKETLVAVFLIVFNAVYISQITKLPMPFKQGEPGPAFVPMLLAAVMLVASVAVLIESLRAPKEEEKEEVRYARPGFVVAATAAFIILLNFLGYWVAAPVYGFLVALIFEYAPDKPARQVYGLPAVIAAALTIFGWLFFEKLFDLSLPMGAF